MTLDYEFKPEGKWVKHESEIIKDTERLLKLKARRPLGLVTYTAPRQTDRPTLR